MLLGNGVVAGVVELWLTLTLTAVASAMVGLALSSLARSTEQVLPMLVVTHHGVNGVGGRADRGGRLVLDQISWLVPARWGFAAAASTVDLNHIEAGLPTDRLWRHVRERMAARHGDACRVGHRFRRCRAVPAAVACT